MQLLYWSETDATLNIYLPFDISVCIYLILSLKIDLAFGVTWILSMHSRQYSLVLTPAY